MSFRYLILVCIFILPTGLIAQNKGDFNSGSWNLDAGVGFDMGLFTLAPTASIGLSRVFKDDPALSEINSKYMSYGLTLGVNIGNDDE